MDEESGMRRESILSRTIKNIRSEWQDHTPKYRKLLLISGIIGLYLSSLLIQNIKRITGSIEHLYLDPISVVVFVFGPGGFIVFLIFWVGIFLGVAIFWTLTKKNYIHDERLKVDILDTGEGGTGHFMTEKEEEEVFYRVRKIQDTDRQVLGFDNHGYLCSKKKVAFTNDNAVICGSPGSGKSACIVFPHIYQAIRQGISCVVTDSKGGIYRESVYIAQKAGYEVKILNLIPPEMAHSDGIQLMKTVKTRMDAQKMANIIITNSSADDAKQNVFDMAAYNLLTWGILYVKFQDIYPEEDKNLITVYKLYIDNTGDELKDMMQQMRPGMPGYENAMSYIGEPEKVQQSALGGLQIKLGLLAQPVVQKILTNDEIDLRAPLSRPCMYYIAIPDLDDTTKFIACLFFTILFNELIDESRRVFHEKPPLSVRFILDEFFSTGAIPGFVQILSVARSAKLDIEFILQDITQLEQMFPKGWRTIMSDCSTKILIRATDPETLEYFESISGEMTTRNASKRYSEASLDPLKIHPAYQMTDGAQKRAVMTASDLDTALSDQELFLKLSGRGPIILKKFQYWEHPFYKIIHDMGHEIATTDHIPVWRQKLIDENRDINDEYGAQDPTLNKPINIHTRDTASNRMHNKQADSITSFFDQMGISNSNDGKKPKNSKPSSPKKPIPPVQGIDPKETFNSEDDEENTETETFLSDSDDDETEFE